MSWSPFRAIRVLPEAVWMKIAGAAIEELPGALTRMVFAVTLATVGRDPLYGRSALEDGRVQLARRRPALRWRNTGTTSALGFDRLRGGHRPDRWMRWRWRN